MDFDFGFFFVLKAYVKVHWARSGYADVYLKDINGNLLYHKKLTGNFWWDGASFYRAKWGLYRFKHILFFVFC